MTPAAPQSTTDPLHAFIAGAFRRGSTHPVPLIRTSFDVRLDGGLATVVTHRTFRNAEEGSIEATITFPVPVHAVLFQLAAKIDGRVVTARAMRKAAARGAYEGAVETGKTAVLHEEVLRGVHMLSIAHIPPGAEIEVIAAWTMMLANVDGVATLRIPLTVGDIYGRSGLPDSDELIAGGRSDVAELSVTSDREVALVGGTLDNGRAAVPLNAPIDLAVAGWAPRDRHGRAADGRAVTVRIEPASVGETPLDAAILVDHSGSMNEACSGRDHVTKHQALVAGLRGLDEVLAGSDRVDLFEFNDGPTHVGTVLRSRSGGTFDFLGGSKSINQLADRLRPPGGGTEIGIALDTAIVRSSAKDLLVVTDGKSHALDVQALARSGRRISVVLVGDDSLEANVGHLAALTDGHVFVSTGADIASGLRAVLRALRVPYVPPAAISPPAQRIAMERGGMSVTARWSEVGQAPDTNEDGRAVAAFAASLALPALEADAAASFAEAEGLVTHLTSLILVDEEGKAQEGLPGTRKIALPTPDMALPTLPQLARSLGAVPPVEGQARRRGAVHASLYRLGPGAAAGDAPPALHDRSAGFASPLPVGVATPSPAAPAAARGDWLDELAARIDWDAAPDRLKTGDLSDLESEIANEIRGAAGRPDVAAEAKRLGLAPIVFLVGLAAQLASGRSRSAARVAKAIFRGKDAADVARALQLLGLSAAAQS